MTILRYKDFLGSIEVDPEDKLLHGKLLYINDLVTYEASTVIELEHEFQNSVNEYLDTCSALNRAPLKPFSGSLNVRIGKELHKEAALHAAMQGISINEFIKVAVQHEIQNEDRMA